MATKIFDLAVKTGSYEVNGETKGRFENVGSVMQGADGNQFLMLKRTFNPAGVTVEPGRDSVLIGMFKPKEDSGRAPTEKRGPATAGATGGADKGFEDDSDIPFAPRDWMDA